MRVYLANIKSSRPLSIDNDGAVNIKIIASIINKHAALLGFPQERAPVDYCKAIGATIGAT